MALAAIAPTNFCSSGFRVCPDSDFFIAACTLGSLGSTGTAGAAGAVPGAVGATAASCKRPLSPDSSISSLR